MKNKLLFWISLVLSFLILLPYAVLSVPGNSDDSEGGREATPVTVLLLGKDHAAGNTDVVLVLRYAPSENSLVMMQIPRDTYLENEFDFPKINHIYPACLANGKNEREALVHTASVIGDALGLTFDMALTVELSALSELVDRIGGVPIRVPMDMSYRDPEQGLSISLPAGETVLDGSMAEQFLRFRSGYLEGDLGRVDAQKLFLLAFMKTAYARMDTKTALGLLLTPPRGILYSGNIQALLPIAMTALSKKEACKSLIFSAPGEAVFADGEHKTWYYVLHRDAMGEALDTYFGSDSAPADFDKRGLFLGEDPLLSQIYFAQGRKLRVYGVDEISDIIIQKK